MKPRTLCFDIGGSSIKARVFDNDKEPLSERARIETPHGMRPPQALDIFKALAEQMPSFERISAGFPGVVKAGKTWTATNLGKGWVGFDLQKALERQFKVPARVANDADVQGLAVIRGNGIELLLTLGTGLGSALFHQGILIPNLQLGHHPLVKGKTYEGLLGKKGLKRWGKQRWNRRIRVAIEVLSQVFNWDHLYLGGGEAVKVEGDLPRNVHIVSNANGLLGGLELWKLPGVHLEKDKRSLLRSVHHQMAGMKELAA